MNSRAITTYILDEKITEIEEYISANLKVGDYFIVPFTQKSRFKNNRNTWKEIGGIHFKTFSFVAFKRSIFVRLAAKRKKNVTAVMLKYDEKIAQNIKHKIPAECTHIVIAQNLLPFAYKQGLLKDRTYDVIMSRLPMELLQQRLNLLKANFPESTTADDFRADETLIDAERIALKNASKIVSLHMEITKFFNHKSIHIEWKKPSQKLRDNKRQKILFPSPGIARKGAYEMRRLALELNLSIHVKGTIEEYPGFWEGVNITYSHGLQDVRLLIIPAYLEHQPILIVKALAYGIPVIATEAVGLSPQDNLILVPVGDYDALKKEVINFLSREQ